MARKQLEVRARRSGMVPGAVVGISSVVFLAYDSTHWHVIRNMVGKQHAALAGMLFVVVLIILTVLLFRRKAGHASITSGDRE